MDAENKANLEKLLAELRVMQARLKQISDSSFGDMEGADMPDFAISQELYDNCERAASQLTQCIEACERHAKT